MADFERAFEARFLIGNGARSVDTSYRKWLLKGAHGECPAEPSKEEKENAEEWHGRCKMLIDEAKSLAEAGIPRDGLKFDDLKRRAMALADECFRGPDRGIVFGYVAQAYDKAGGSATGPERNEDVTKWITYPRMDAEKFRMVREIQKLASFGDEYKEKLSDICAEFMRDYNDASLCEIAQANGVLFSKLKDEAYTFGFKADGESLLKSRLVEVEFPDHGIFGFLYDKIFESYYSGEKALKRQKDFKNIKNAGAGAAAAKADGC